MIFWIIKDGEKCGPFEDYELREMIREGEVNEETRVWHEGADGWVPAPEIAVLAGEFEKKVVLPPPIPLEISPFRPWLRLGARFFDYMLYTALLNGIFVLMGVSLVRQDPSGWLIVAILVPAILMEGALVSSWGFTPGKWLLGLRVETLLKQRLTTGRALIRSMRVWILGMGMTEPILMFFGHCWSLWFGLKKGSLLWDLQSGFQVSSEKVSTKRLVIFWILLILIFGLKAALILPEVWPEIEEEMRRQGKWST